MEEILYEKAYCVPPKGDKTTICTDAIDVAIHGLNEAANMKVQSTLKDSGKRMSFGENAAVREPSIGKGRYDLLWPTTLQRLSVSLMEEYDEFKDIYKRAHGKNQEETRNRLINLINEKFGEISYFNCDSEKANYDYLSSTLFLIMEFIELETNGKFFNEFDDYPYVIPPTALDKIAKHFEAGSIKYSDHNWAKGMYMTRYFDSAMRHFTQAVMGCADEPHSSACAWNIGCMMHTQTMMPSFNNFHIWEKDGDVTE